MKSESSYQKLLRDPRWQKKRLEILDRANWRCQDAGCNSSQTEPLEVHHCYYLWGIKPWDYPVEAFLALCEHCHKHRQKVEASVKVAVMKRLRLVPIERLEQVCWEMVDKAIKEGAE